jgi:hypothetical protein
VLGVGYAQLDVDMLGGRRSEVSRVDPAVIQAGTWKPGKSSSQRRAVEAPGAPSMSRELTLARKQYRAHDLCGPWQGLGFTTPCALSMAGLGSPALNKF